jgi:multiple sugar transport system permease protein
MPAQGWRSPMTRGLYGKLYPYLLLLPAFLIAGVVLVYPLLNGIALSLTSYTMLVPQYAWVGLRNFVLLFKDPVYWEVFLNSLFIVFVAVVIQVSLGLVVALLLNAAVPLRSFFRGAVFIIWIIPMMVVSLLWMIIYNSEFGILNHILKSLGLVREYVTWLGRPWPARSAIIITHGWRGVPFFMVMILAALQTIPTDIVDASKIDGAGAFQRFVYITIPYIRHILLLSCLLSVVRLFQDITLIYILTLGGPKNATTTLSVYVYKQAFQSFQMAKAAAIGVTWLIFLLVLAVFYVRLVTRGEFRT